MTDLEQIAQLTAALLEANTEMAGYRRTTEAVALENARLRAVLTAHRINPDRCGVFVQGDHCTQPVGHAGPHQWAGGD